MTKKGGRNDPVAQSIRNEQNRDAMPSEDEIKRNTKKREVIHAQWKAVEQLMDSIGSVSRRKQAIPVFAEILGFDELKKKTTRKYRRGNNGPGFITRHEEAWEKPDTDDLPRQARQRRAEPFDLRHDMERVRELKMHTFSRIQEVDPNDFSVAVERIARFGNRTAVAVTYDGDVYSNQTWSRVMDDSEWESKRVDEQTKKKYQSRLEDALDGV